MADAVFQGQLDINAFSLRGLALVPIQLLELVMTHPKVLREKGSAQSIEAMLEGGPPDGAWADDLVQHLALRPVKNAHVMAFSLTTGEPDLASEPVFYELDENGTLLDNRTRKKAMFPPGAQFRYFWSYEKSLIDKAKAQFQEASDAFDAEKLKHFFASHPFADFCVKRDHVVGAENVWLFRNHVRREPRLQMLLSLLVHSLLGPGVRQGLLPPDEVRACDGDWLDAKGLKTQAKVPQITGHGLLVRKPAMASLHLAELISAFAANDAENGSWCHTVFDMMKGAVEESQRGSVDAGHASEALTELSKKASTFRDINEKMRRYAYDCAHARHRKTGKALPESLFKDAVHCTISSRDWITASKKIVEEYYVEHPIGRVVDIDNLASALSPTFAEVGSGSLLDPMVWPNIDRDFALSMFQYYALGSRRAEYPRGKAWEPGDKPEPKAKPWRDRIIEDEHLRGFYGARVRQEVQRMLAEQAPWKTMMHDLGAHTPAAERDELHVRYNHLAITAGYFWWDSLPTSKEEAEPFYDAPMKAYLKLVFGGKTDTLADLFVLNAKSLLAVVLEQKKKDFADATRQLASAMVLLNQQSEVGGGTLEPFKPKIELSLARQQLRISGLAGVEERIVDGFFLVQDRAKKDSFERAADLFHDLKKATGIGSLGNALKVLGEDVPKGLREAAAAKEVSAAFAPSKESLEAYATELEAQAKTASKTEAKSLLKTAKWARQAAVDPEKTGAKALYWKRSGGAFGAVQGKIKEASTITCTIDMDGVTKLEGKASEFKYRSAKPVTLGNGVPKFFSAFASIVAVADGMTHLSDQLRQKGGIITALSLAQNTAAIVENVGGALEWACNFANKSLVAGKWAQRFEAIGNFGATLGSVVVLASFADAVYLAYQVPKSFDNRQPLLGVLQTVQATTNVAACVATTVIVGTDVILGGVGFAAAFAATAPIGVACSIAYLGFSIAKVCIEPYYFTEKLEVAFTKALNHEFGDEFGGSRAEHRVGSRSASRMVRLEEETKQVCRLARNYEQRVRTTDPFAGGLAFANEP